MKTFRITKVWYIKAKGIKEASNKGKKLKRDADEIRINKLRDKENYNYGGLK